MATSSDGRPDPGFLGTGWSFPPSFGASGASVATVSGADDVHQSLQILFATQPGERVLQDAFGCDLRAEMFEEVDQSLVNRIRARIRNAIVQHEPRIALERVTVSPDDALQGRLLIELTYTIRSTNSRYNMVYPFYLEETSPRVA
jgi:uncharacterized protein